MKLVIIPALGAGVALRTRRWLVCLAAVGCGSAFEMPDAGTIADATVTGGLDDATLRFPDAAMSPADAADTAVPPDAPMAPDASPFPDAAPTPDALLEADATDSFDAPLAADAMDVPDALLPDAFPDAFPDASPDVSPDATAGPDAGPTYTLRISNFLSWCSITENGKPYSSSKPFPVDSVVELSAAPIEPFIWGYWTGTDGDLGPEHDTAQMTTVTMTSDKNVLACCPTMVNPTCN